MLNINTGYNEALKAACKTLRDNRAAAKSMSIFEFDEELHMRQEAIGRMLKCLSPEDIINLGYNVEEIRKVQEGLGD